MALVFIVDPELTATTAEQRLRNMYGLTRAEAALTNLVSKGGGVKMAARTLARLSQLATQNGPSD
jgi:hypothetical protein